MSNDTNAAPVCAWCGATASSDASHCPACGAALAQRDSIADLVIPGVTDVDPELRSYANQPLRIPRGSASDRLAGPTISAAAGGDPTGMLAIGAFAIVAAKEYTSIGGGRPEVDPEKMGVPSAPVREMAERLNREEKARADAPAPDSPPGEAPDKQG